MANVTVVENGVTIKKKTPELLNNLDSSGIMIPIDFMANDGVNASTTHQIHSEIVPSDGKYIVGMNMRLYTDANPANVSAYRAMLTKSSTGTVYPAFMVVNGNINAEGISSNTFMLDLVAGETLDLSVQVDRSDPLVANRILNDDLNGRSYLSLFKVQGYV